jgi:hypothetical protein
MPLRAIKRAGPVKSLLDEVKGRLRVATQAFVWKRFLSAFQAKCRESTKAGQTKIRGQEFFVTVVRGATIEGAITAARKSKHLIFSLN